MGAAGVLALAAATSVHAEPAASEPHTVSTVLVRAPKARAPAPSPSPATTETVTAETLKTGVNLINTEDSLKYLPSLVVRKRHIGDTQAPLATRTSGVGSSARSLVYADGVLLSALIGNNNTSASPRWGMVAPGEIDRVEVLYGPFSAAYPGNSIGAVVNIITRMPEHLEGSAKAGYSVQRFDQYGTRGDFPAHQFSASFGDRVGAFAFRLDATRTAGDSQPLAYATALRPTAPSSAGTPATGAFLDVNRLGAPIAVTGAGGFEHQEQTNLKLKTAWDIGPDLTLTYTLGAFLNDTDSQARTYLSDAAGAPVYAGTANIGGYAYALPASLLSNNVYAFDERHWTQSLSLNGHAGRLDWQVVASRYDYDLSRQRVPSTALPAAASGGAGSITRMNGTGWKTLDARASWTSGADNDLNLGAHADAYRLESRRYLTSDWISGPQGALAAASRGQTRTWALWGEDVWRPASDLTLTLGARWERWRAEDGFNYSLSPALAAVQPEVMHGGVSPKATLAWTPAPQWTLKLSAGRALRFPTVSELYQAVATGPAITVPNPNLAPERAWSQEASAERSWRGARVRLSVFNEDISDALISQSAPLVPGSPTLFSYVQNIGRTHARGVELVADKDNVLIPGLSLSGSATWVDATIARDAAFPAAVGKRTPQVPRWRATATASWRASDRLTLALSGRYSSRAFGTIDNSDPVSNTFQGFSDYLVVDARASYRLDRRWRAAIGMDNAGNQSYFLFHPFPQRTLFAELEFAL